jgi:hypothetical protein
MSYVIVTMETFSLMGSKQVMTNQTLGVEIGVGTLGCRKSPVILGPTAEASKQKRGLDQILEAPWLLSSECAVKSGLRMNTQDRMALQGNPSSEGKGRAEKGENRETGRCSGKPGRIEFHESLREHSRKPC